MSKQLQTYPSTNPTLTLTCFHVAIVGYGKELVRNYPDAENDPNVLRFGPTYLFCIIIGAVNSKFSNTEMVLFYY